MCALCEITKRRRGRCAWADAGRPGGRPRRPARSADLLSFLFSIINQTRASPFSSVISAGRLRTALHHWDIDPGCPLRRLKTANTRRLTRTYTSLFCKRTQVPGDILAKRSSPQEPRRNQSEVDNIANSGGDVQVEKATIFQANRSSNSSWEISDPGSLCR